MTQTEWDNASEEERTAEFERCKDPLYVYNNYLTFLINGVVTKPKPMSQEEWEQQKKLAEEIQLNRFRRYRRRLNY